MSENSKNGDHVFPLTGLYVDVLYRKAANTHIWKVKLKLLQDKCSKHQ